MSTPKFTFNDKLDPMEILEDLINRLNWFLSHLDENNVKRLRIIDNKKIVLESFKDTNGGVVKIFDKDGQLNVKVGSESGETANVGGTMVLYLDVPEGADPLEYIRVALGISTETGAGLANFHDTTGAVRASIKADDSSTGPIMFLVDGAGVIKTYLTLTTGKINGETIATQAWVNSQISAAISDHIATHHTP